MNEEISTLGQRLDGQAQRLAARSVHVSRWAMPFEVLVGHLSMLPSPDGGRFARTEIALAQPMWPSQAPGRDGGVASSAVPQRVPLFPDVAARLRTVVGPGVDAGRVPGDDAADGTVRAHRADAVAFDSEVFFPQRQLYPQGPDGIGQLGPVQAPGRTSDVGPSAVSQGRSLSPDLTARLRTVVGPGVEAMRVHDDDAADETARAHRADAVAFDSEVFFRQGQFNPQEPRGFGLLVHEATHVAERSRPGDSWRQATQGAAPAEESLALTREAAVVAELSPAGQGLPLLAPSHAGDPQDVFNVPSGTFGAPGDVAPASFPASATAAFSSQGATAQVAPMMSAAPAETSAARPMTAAIDRPTATPPASQQPFDVDALRGRIMRDLMRQLRDEFERGA